MQSTVTAARRALGSGTVANVTSTLVLLAAGVRDCRSALAPLNAVSHWLWKDKAIHQQDVSWRYSASGYCIHHAASIFWALLYERWATRGGKASGAQVLGRAAAVTTVAYTVDLYGTPERFTPGFERRLRPASLLLVYGAFGLGLALHTMLRDTR